MGTVTPRLNVCQRCRWVILPEGRTLCYFCERPERRVIQPKPNDYGPSIVARAA